MNKVFAKYTYVNDKALIEACKKGERKAQKVLYETHGPLMFSICRRYLSRIEDAEDVFVHGMSRIFENLHKYSGKGSFQGWMRKLMVNECLMFIRKNKNFKYTSELDVVDKVIDPVSEDNLYTEDILKLLDKLPPGYRTVFNLYVIEGFKHREIAAQLNISINTSKSQLILARKKMQELVRRLKYPDVG